MMMRSTSASNLFDAMMSPAVGAETEEGCSHPLLPITMEKRKHAEIGDGSPQSRPPLTEKRNRGENGQQPPEYLRPRGKHGGCKCKGEEKEGCKCKGGGVREDMSFDKLPAYAQQYFLKLKADFGDTYAVGTCCTDDDDDEQIGDAGYMFADLDPNRENYSDCCSNPFIPLDFKQDPKVYNEVRLFGEKAVADFNAKYKETVCFEDIETVTSCRSSCKHHKVTIKVIDSCEKFSVIVLRGKVRGGFPEAEANEFVMLGFYRV